MRILRTLAAVGFVLAVAAPARADMTAFLGANTTPANRQVRGGALGTGFVIIGFESSTPSPRRSGGAAPSLKTGMGNILLQAPFQDFQPYITSGVGILQRIAGTHSETNFGRNAGGGVKIGLAGRFDCGWTTGCSNWEAVR
jgi:hypothetical protein